MSNPASLRVNLRGRLDAKSLHHGDCRLQRRIAVLAEGAVELLAGKAGLAGNLRHAFGARRDARRVRDVARNSGSKYDCNDTPMAAVQERR